MNKRYQYNLNDDDWLESNKWLLHPKDEIIIKKALEDFCEYLEEVKTENPPHENWNGYIERANDLFKRFHSVVNE